MPAIITDQFRILNAETFAKSVTGIGTTSNFYYTFLAHPNPENDDIEEYGVNGWPQNVPDPRDSFEQESAYHGSMLFLNRIGVNDFARIVPRINWSAGITYDMYRHDYDITNAATQTSAKTLYDSRFYVVTSEFKVYLCINNGTSFPDFRNGKPSQFEPRFVSNSVQKANDSVDDGYRWKYLYTISPADIVKFVTEKFIPVPNNWGDVATASVKNAAVRGALQTIIIKDPGQGYTSNTYNDIDILGDGVGGKCSVIVTDGQVTTVAVSNPGRDYTRGVINFVGDGAGGSGASFDVIIPPKGGHGADIYRELGAYRVMVHSKYDIADDFAAQNNFSRIGIVRNPTVYGSQTEILNSSTATSLGALKLKPDTTDPGITTSMTNYPLNAEIRQTVGTATSVAVGYVASWDRDTGVLRYYQPVGLSTISNNGFKNFDFEGTTKPITCVSIGGSTLIPDTSFVGTAVTISNSDIRNLGQSFTAGKATPEVEKFSGDIIYIDNRAPISRSESQKEEVKIVVEF